MPDSLNEDGSEQAGMQSTLLLRRFNDTLYLSRFILGAYFLKSFLSF
jgi:AraC-like DNA-binding protein